MNAARNNHHFNAQLETRNSKLETPAACRRLFTKCLTRRAGRLIQRRALSLSRASGATSVACEPARHQFPHLI
jgi:hypothetical protein